jgi:hypothetical protein
MRMPRLGIFNMMFGFLALFLAAAAGPFLATEITSGYLRDKALLDTWTLLLQKSSHGHTNLFGLVHIAFGLTMPYSILPTRAKLLQTIGFGLGTVAMGVVMLVRAALGPVDGIDPTEIALGVMLSCALAALGTHALGLAGKLLQKPV